MHDWARLNYMAVSRGTVTRAANLPSVLLQARISPELKDEIAAAAADSGVSVAFYLEALLNSQASGGALPRIAAPARVGQLELPINAA